MLLADIELCLLTLPCVMLFFSFFSFPFLSFPCLANAEFCLAFAWFCEFKALFSAHNLPALLLFLDKSSLNSLFLCTLFE